MEGTVTPGFESVGDVLERAITNKLEYGASFTVYLEGECIVDIWAGEAEAGKPWQSDTMTNVFSCGKGATAFCAQLLYDRGQLDVEAKVSSYWPEFARGGKDQVTVRMLLNHTVGLPELPRPEGDEAGRMREIQLDHVRCAAMLAEASPQWKPGDHAAYHSLTYGWLVGEVVRRISGQSLGEFFRAELGDPLDLDFHIGLPDACQERMSDIRPQAPDRGALKKWLDQMKDEQPDQFKNTTVAGIVEQQRRQLDWFNEPATRRAQIPAANGSANARGLARLYAPLSCEGQFEGKQWVSPESIDYFNTPNPIQIDFGNMTPVCLGYMGVASQRPEMGAGLRSFGHEGMGNSMGFADPDHRLAIGFVHNQLNDGQTRNAIIQQVYSCMEKMPRPSVDA